MINAMSGLQSTLNTIGPNTDPCGTLYFTTHDSDTCSCTFTTILRSDNYHENIQGPDLNSRSPTLNAAGGQKQHSDISIHSTIFCLLPNDTELSSNIFTV